jgi:ABC-2 type transport system permease protein
LRGAIRAVVELRTRLFWRRFTGKGGVPEGVALAILFLLALPLGLLFAGLIAVGSYQAASAGEGLRVAVGVPAMFFGLWQAWTALALSLGEQDGLDLRRLLVYPLPPRRLHLLGLASGLVGDPIGLVWLLLLGSILAGAAAARPGPWLLPLAMVILAFTFSTLFLVGLLRELVAGLLRARRLREVVIGLSLAVLAWAFVAAAGRGHGSMRTALPVLARLQWVAWPAALASGAATRLYARDIPASLPYLAALLAATALGGWLSYRVSLAAARSGGEGGGAATANGSGWRLGPLEGRFAAVLEKEAKYLWRHPLARIYALIIPAFAALVAWKAEPSMPREAGEVVRALPLLAFAVYTHLVMQIFWLNALGWERGGARTWYLAPVGLSSVLAAKNAALYAWSLLVFALAAGLAILVGGRPPAWALLAGLALHAGLAPILYGLGNLVSVLNPRAAPFAVQRNGSLSWLSGLAGMGILSAASGLFALPVLFALRLESPWLVPTAWALLGLAGFAAYWRTLPSVAGLLARRRDALLPEVCGDDA